MNIYGGKQHIYINQPVLQKGIFKTQCVKRKFCQNTGDLENVPGKHFRYECGKRCQWRQNHFHGKGEQSGRKCTFRRPQTQRIAEKRNQREKSEIIRRQRRGKCHYSNGCGKRSGKQWTDPFPQMKLYRFQLRFFQILFIGIIRRSVRIFAGNVRGNIC